MGLGFIGRFLGGILAEGRDTLAVLPRLRWPFWFWYFLALTTVAAPYALPRFSQIQIPLPTLAIAVGAIAAIWGLLGIFSGVWAYRLRRWKWVSGPDDALVLGGLSDLLIVMAMVPFLAAVTAAFWLTGQAYPEHLPAPTLLASLTLVIDNLLRTSVLFDAAEIFGWQFGEFPTDNIGRTILFVSRLFLDIAFVKLVAQVMWAAYHRAKHLGRGEDTLALLDEAIARRDVPRVSYLGRKLADSVSSVLNSLCLDAAKPKKADASSIHLLSTLKTMKDLALAHMRKRMQICSVVDHDAFTQVSAELQDEDTITLFIGARVSRFRQFLRGLRYPVLAALLALPWLLSGTAQLIVLTSTLVLTVALMFRWRTWVQNVMYFQLFARTQNIDAQKHVRSLRLVPMLMLWLGVLLPLVMVQAAGVLMHLGQLSPGFLAGRDTVANVDFTSSLVYVGQVVLHTDLLADWFEIYHVHVSPLVPGTIAACWVTFVLRLVIDLGLIAVVASTIQVMVQRRFLKMNVTPYADLRLRQLPQELNALTAMRAAQHIAEIRAFLAAKLNQSLDHPALCEALFASGLIDPSRTVQVFVCTPNQVHFLLARSRAWLAQGNLENARADITSIETIFSHVREQLLDGRRRTELIELHLSIAEGCIAVGMMPESSKQFDACVQQFAQLDEHQSGTMMLLGCRVQMVLGSLYLRFGKYDDAINHHNQALSTFRSITNRDALIRGWMGQTLAELAYLAYKTNQNTDAIAKAREALSMATNRHDMAMAHSAWGLASFRLEKLREVDAHLEYAIDCRIDRLTYEINRFECELLAEESLVMSLLTYNRKDYANAAHYHRLQLRSDDASGNRCMSPVSATGLRLRERAIESYRRTGCDAEAQQELLMHFAYSAVGIEAQQWDCVQESLRVTLLSISLLGNAGENDQRTLEALLLRGLNIAVGKNTAAMPESLRDQVACVLSIWRPFVQDPRPLDALAGATRSDFQGLLPDNMSEKLRTIDGYIWAMTTTDDILGIRLDSRGWLHIGNIHIEPTQGFCTVTEAGVHLYRASGERQPLHVLLPHSATRLLYHDRQWYADVLRSWNIAMDTSDATAATRRKPKATGSIGRALLRVASVMIGTVMGVSAVHAVTTHRQSLLSVPTVEVVEVAQVTTVIVVENQPPPGPAMFELPIMPNVQIEPMMQPVPLPMFNPMGVLMPVPMPLMPVPMLIPIPVPMPPVVAKLPSYREQFTSKVELNATRSGSLPVFYRSEDQREDRVQVLELDATRPLRLQIETIKHSAVVTRSKAMGQPDTQQIAGEAHGGKVEYTWSGGQYVAKVIKEPESKMDRRNFARPRRQMLHLGSLPTRELQAGESETVAHNERTAAVAEDMGIGQPRGPMVIRYLGLQQIDQRTMARYDVKLPTLFQQPMGGETVSIPLLTQYELVFDVDGEFVRSVQGQTRGRQTVGTSTYTFDWEFTARRDAQ